MGFTLPQINRLAREALEGHGNSYWITEFRDLVNSIDLPAVLYRRPYRAGPDKGHKIVPIKAVQLTISGMDDIFQRDIEWLKNYLEELIYEGMRRLKEDE